MNGWTNIRTKEPRESLYLRELQNYVSQVPQDIWVKGDEKREAKLTLSFVRPDAHKCGRHFAQMVQPSPAPPARPPGTSRPSHRVLPPSSLGHPLLSLIFQRQPQLRNTVPDPRCIKIENLSENNPNAARRGPGTGTYPQGEIPGHTGAP